MIVLPEEELKHLERHFGSDVRQMGPWNTDGSFAFCAVPISAVENAAQTLSDPSIHKAVERLRTTHNPTQRFIEILQACGLPLIRRIVAAYREQLAHSYGRPRVRTAGESA